MKTLFRTLAKRFLFVTIVLCGLGFPVYGHGIGDCSNWPYSYSAEHARHCIEKHDRFIDETERLGYTALLNAALWNKSQLARYLIRKGADVNAQNYKGNTPLHFAVINNNAPLCRYLLSAGGDPDMQNRHGVTAVDIAREEGYTDCLEIFAAKERSKQF